MTKNITITDAGLIFLSAFFFCLALAKYTQEYQAQMTLGGDVVVSREGSPPDLGVQAYFGMTTTARSQIMTVETAARAQETEERPESRPTAVTLKVIDRAYPIYGQLKLENKVRALTFASYALGRQQGAAVNEALLKKLKLVPGETFLIGSTVFIATAVITSEPDYRPKENDIPRILISDRAFAALVKQGMYFENRQVFELRGRVNKGTDLNEWKQSFDGMNAQAGWTSALWTDEVSPVLLLVKMPFLLITAGIFLLIFLIRFELRKQRAVT